MSISAINISKYIVTKCNDDNCPITNLQLQKILYYIQKEFLDKGLESFEEEIEAWRFGPVVADVYYTFFRYGAKPITAIFADIEISNEHQPTIDRITNDKRKLSPWALVEDTHKVNSAWYKTFDNGSGYQSVITKELIKNEQ